MCLAGYVSESLFITMLLSLSYLGPRDGIIDKSTYNNSYQYPEGIKYTLVLEIIGREENIQALFVEEF